MYGVAYFAACILNRGHHRTVTLEGRLAEMLQVVGIEKADAEFVDSASAVSGQLVAGARNHRYRHSLKALI